MTIGNGETLKLVVRDDFSFTPGSRYVGEGDYSGEEFRQKHLKPALESAIERDLVLTVVLDGTAGYGTSFLEEAFGGLIRDDKIAHEIVLKHLKFVSSEEPYLEEDILQYMSDANVAESGK